MKSLFRTSLQFMCTLYYGQVENYETGSMSMLKKRFISFVPFLVQPKMEGVLGFGNMSSTKILCIQHFF